MRTLNLIALQHKQVPIDDQIRNLVEVVKLYRKQEKAYYAKVKRKEFAKDELHFLMKTKQKLDSLLSNFNY